MAPLVKNSPEIDPLEKEMATDSNILVWEIRWTKEPAGYSPWVARVGHDLATKLPPPHPFTYSPAADKCGDIFDNTCYF